VTNIITLNTYDKCVLNLKKILEKNKNIISAIVFGNVAKKTTVPEWSDIDLLIIIKGKNTLSTYKKLTKMLTKLRKKYKIKIGADIITDKESINPFLAAGEDSITIINDFKNGIALKGNNIFNTPNQVLSSEFVVFDNFSHFKIIMSELRKTTISLDIDSRSKMISLTKKAIKLTLNAGKLYLEIINRKHYSTYDEVVKDFVSLFPNKMRNVKYAYFLRENWKKIKKCNNKKLFSIVLKMVNIVETMYFYLLEQIKYGKICIEGISL
jgi:predicted nucleotidyltransferase